MTKETGLSRRSFLKGSALAGITAAAALGVAPKEFAFAEAEGITGDWSADGSHLIEVPASADTNASSADGTYRDHNGSVFAANDGSPIPPRAVPAKWDYECDICVIGAGGGGLTAAARSAELGAKVICIDTMAVAGGNAQSAGVAMILGGTKIQNELKMGFPTYPFDPDALADWALDEYHYAADPKLLRLIARAGGIADDWMGDCGVPWEIGSIPVYLTARDAPVDHHSLKMKEVTDAMFAYGMKQGVDFHFRSPAVALVQDASGRIVGVVAKENYDHEVYIHAPQAVIMTAGGFCNNKALLDKYIPTAAMGCTCSYLIAGERGDCFRMGLGVNADVSGFNSSGIFDGGLDWEAEGGAWAHFLYDGATQLVRQPWLCVDRTGNRMRYMDSNIKRSGVEAVYALGDLATVQMTSPGHRSYVVFDSKYEDYLADFGQNACRRFISPDLSYIENVPEHYRDWRHGVQDAIDADVIKVRNSIEELEEALGLEPGVLTDAVEHWNKNCEAGEDDYMYPMPAEWLHEIATPPFYGARIGGNIYSTKTGLLINDHMQVIDTRGRVIEGLYAGWHTAGGSCGENSYVGDPMLGSILGDVNLAFTGGYLCGTFANGKELGE